MDFKSFLKKYSNVSTKFIDDFYEVINEDLFEKYSEFIIDSEMLRKWL